MTDGTKIAAAILAAEAARQIDARAPKPTGMNDPAGNLMGYFQRFAVMIEQATPTKAVKRAEGGPVQ